VSNNLCDDVLASSHFSWCANPLCLRERFEAIKGDETNSLVYLRESFLMNCTSNQLRMIAGSYSVDEVFHQQDANRLIDPIMKAVNDQSEKAMREKRNEAREAGFEAVYGKGRELSDDELSLIDRALSEMQQRTTALPMGEYKHLLKVRAKVLALRTDHLYREMRSIDKYSKKG
jgi:hypothetical protein